jgi:hypothetical protein
MKASEARRLKPGDIVKACVDGYRDERFLEIHSYPFAVKMFKLIPTQLIFEAEEVEENGDEVRLKGRNGHIWHPSHYIDHRNIIELVGQSKRQMIGCLKQTA